MLKKNSIIPGLAIILALTGSSCSKDKSFLTPSKVKLIVNQYSNTLAVSTDLTDFPERSMKKGIWLQLTCTIGPPAFLPVISGSFMN